MIRLEKNNSLLRSWQAEGSFHLDVRELLEQGEEPYVYIMDCVRQIGEGDRLTIHVLFKPKPLIDHVQRMGFAVSVGQEAPEHWVVSVQLAH